MDTSIAGRGYNIYTYQWQHDADNNFQIEFSTFNNNEIPVFGLSSEGIKDMNENSDQFSYLILSNIKLDEYFANWLAQDAKTNQVIQISDFNYGGNAEIQITDSTFKNLSFDGYSYFFFVFFVSEKPITFQNCIWDNMQGFAFYTWGFQNPKTTVIFDTCQFKKIVVNDLLMMIQSLDMSRIYFRICEFIENSSVGVGSLALATSASEDLTYHEYISCKFINNYFPNEMLTYIIMGWLYMQDCQFQENFGIRHGVIKIADGEFKLDDCQFTENNGIYLSLFNIQNSKFGNTISNTIISNNNHLDAQEFIDDIRAGIKPLDFFSDLFMSFLLNEVTALEEFITAKKFQILMFQADLTFQDCTITKANKFLSAVIQALFYLKDSFLSQTQLTKDEFLFSVTQSHFEIDGSQIQEISTIDTSYERKLLQIVSESDILLESSTFQQISIPMFGCIDSVIETYNCVYQNLQNQFIPQMFDFQDSKYISQNNIFSDINVSIHQFILRSQNSELIITEDTFKEFPQGGLKIEHSILIMKKSTFQDLLARNDLTRAQAIFIVQDINDPYDIEIDETVIQRCGSFMYDGGAIHSDNGHILITNSQFIDNLGRFGGAIYYKCELDDISCKMEIKNSKFFNNEAQQIGGALYYETKQITELNCIYENNKAQYGQDIGSYPIRIDMVLQDGQIIKQENFRIPGQLISGQQFTQNIKFALLDQYDQIFGYNNQNFANINAINEQNQVKEGQNINSINGLYEIKDVIFIGVPGSQNNEFEIETSAISQEKILRYYPEFTRQNTFKFIIDFEECDFGEQNIGNICTKCQENKYSLEKNTKECLECPENMACPGGNQLVIQEGFWRPDHLRPDIFECLAIDACPGGLPREDGKPQQCSQGYYGILCHECLFVQGNTYSRVGKHSCAECGDPTSNLIQILLLASIIFIAIIVLTKINLAKKKDSVTSILFRIFTNYFQVLSSAASFNMAWPEAVQYYFDQVQYVGETSQAIVSFDCLVGTQGTAQVESLYFLKILAVAFLPIGILLIFYIAWIIPQIKYRSLQFYKRSIIVTTVVIMFLIHPTLTEMTFSMFKCYDVDGVNYLERDFNIQCWSDDHVAWALGLGLPMIIIYVLGVPIFGFLLLLRNKKKLENENFLGRYRMIYQGMRPKRFYWEFVNVFRKIWLIIINVFLSGLDNFSQALLALCMLLLLLRFQLKLKPYKVNLFNEIQFREAIASLVTLYGGLFFTNHSTPEPIKYFAIVLILGINVWFFSIWLYTLFSQPFLQKYCGACMACWKKYLVGNQRSLDIEVQSEGSLTIPQTVEENTSRINTDQKHARPNDDLSQRDANTNRKLLLDAVQSNAIKEKQMDKTVDQLLNKSTNDYGHLIESVYNNYGSIDSQQTFQKKRRLIKKQKVQQSNQFGIEEEEKDAIFGVSILKPGKSKQGKKQNLAMTKYRQMNDYNQESEQDEQNEMDDVERDINKMQKKKRNLKNQQRSRSQNKKRLTGHSQTPDLQQSQVVVRKKKRNGAKGGSDVELEIDGSRLQPFDSH